MREKKIVVVDIDGTISKVGDRLKYITGDVKDYKSFYNECYKDCPIQKIIDLVELLSKDYQIVFLTGRRESVRDITSDWLSKHLPFLLYNDVYSRLLMRPMNDVRHDTEVKPERLLLANIKKEDVFLIIEDRNSMVDKWRELGYTVLQPAYGDF